MSIKSNYYLTKAHSHSCTKRSSGQLFDVHNWQKVGESWLLFNRDVSIHTVPDNYSCIPGHGNNLVFLQPAALDSSDSTFLFCIIFGEVPFRPLIFVCPQQEVCLVAMYGAKPGSICYAPARSKSGPPLSFLSRPLLCRGHKILSVLFITEV